MSSTTPELHQTWDGSSCCYLSPSMSESMLYLWNWGDEHLKGDESPSSISTACSEAGIRQRTSQLESKRGRPRAEIISHLIVEGSTSPSAIKCTYCNRVFPREKSLQAHLRTHTGERPYPCDYPGCNRAFTQSGQRKTHQRLHTGEKPFVCSHIGCEMRFTHANRHCPQHPFGGIHRSDDFVLRPVESNPEQSSEVLRWLERYKLEREERTPSKTPTKITQKRYKTKKREIENENTSSSLKKPKFRKDLSNEMEQQENVCKFPNTQWHLSPGPSSDLDSDGVGLSSPDSWKCKSLGINSLQPKKRWLREAFKDQSLWGDKQELAQPLHWTEKNEDANQTRPTVLMLANKDLELNHRPCNGVGEDSLKWMGAMALMQLAKTKQGDYAVGTTPISNMAQPRYTQL